MKKYAFVVILLILVVYSIGHLKESTLITPSLSVSSAKPSNENTMIECVGIDGRELTVTQKQCNDYNKASKITKDGQAPTYTPLNNWETEANLPVIQENKTYDFVLLGSSHARIFSRYSNHERVEKILDKTFINLSQGGDRAGVLNQQTYLRYFYSKGNSAPVLVYFVDPYIFFNAGMDNNTHLYDVEPFDLDFYYELLTNQPENSKILDTYVSKLEGNKKITNAPDYRATSKDDTTSSPSAEIVSKRWETLYKDIYDQKSFDDTLMELMETVAFAREQKMKVILIVPSTLFPQKSDDHYFFEALSKKSKDKKYEYYDYSSAITNTDLYFDVDHLNTKGVITFTTEFLKPVLSK